MQGQTLWCHYPPSPSDAAPLIARLKASRCQSVALKRSEGSSNIDNQNFDYQASFNALTPQLIAAGFTVYAWTYVYPGDRLGAIVADAAAHGSAAHILDVETEFDGPNGTADITAVLADIAAVAPNVHLAYAPFPECAYHPQYPYAALDAACKVCMPQIYWCDLGMTPGSAYNACWTQMNAAGLIGPGHATWQPIGQSDGGATAADIAAFAAACRNNGAQPIPGISWWVLDDQPAALDAALAATPYAGDVVPKPRRQPP